MTDYTIRINRVLDYIQEHLDSALTLEELAGIACFSNFHFSRIFSIFTGETPFQLIQRLRLEKSANLLLHRPDKKIIDIALSCGFSNTAAFSRAFREYLDCTPSQWRSSCGKNSNPGIVKSKLSEECFSWQPYIEYQQGVQLWRMKKNGQERQVEVTSLAALNCAYIRYVGPYKGDALLFERLWTRLCAEAGAQELIDNDSQYLAVYHDNPELTKDSKLRVTIAVSTSKPFEGSGRLGHLWIPGGKYAIAHFRLNSSEYQEAWDWLYSQWLPQSGYLPDDRPAFEWFPQEADQSADGRNTVRICIPLIAAS
ncbi:MAG: AraC family transcriptional regulator [Spirochaetes bacterium]|nr:AraC family transcriptional regulator [Spirochaetota bacterium]MBU0955691.1 AraC family transcriptional regulator [Spirochaetota bacterium]